MASAGSAASPSYPVAYDVEPQLTGRNRLTVGFRAILSIPHAIIVGTPGIGNRSQGLLGAVALFLAIVAWFAILFTGRYPRGLFDYVVGVIRWSNRVTGYAMVLVTDEYPPFSLE